MPVLAGERIHVAVRLVGVGALGFAVGSLWTGLADGESAFGSRALRVVALLLEVSQERGSRGLHPS